MNYLELVEHPHHVLGRGHDVWRSHVEQWAEVSRHLSDPASAESLLLSQAQRPGIANDGALRPAERQVHDGALSGHQHRQSANIVNGRRGVKSDASLVRTASIVVLNTNASEHLTRAVVHANGDDEVMLAHRCTKERRGRGIQPQPIRDAIKLRLCLTECGSRRGPCSYWVQRLR